MATLRELEYLLAVAETGTITAASARLHVTQSAMSQGLASLERDFGGPLLHRDSRGVALTAAARAVLSDAQLAVVAAGRARRTARSVAGVDSGSLRVACAPSLTVGLLPTVLPSWHAAYPDISIELDEYSDAPSGIEAVLSGRSDLVIGASPGPSSQGIAPGLQAQRLGREELLVALPRNDDLAGAQLADLSPLADRRWVCYRAGHPMDTALTALAAEAGFNPTPAVRVSDTSAGPALAAAGLGPALVPHTILLSSPYPGALLHVGRGVHRDIVVARRAADAVTTRFIDLLVAHGIPALQGGSYALT